MSTNVNGNQLTCVIQQQYVTGSQAGSQAGCLAGPQDPRNHSLPSSSLSGTDSNDSFSLLSSSSLSTSDTTTCRRDRRLRRLLRPASSSAAAAGGTALGASGRSNNGIKLDVKTGKLSLWRLFPTFAFALQLPLRPASSAPALPHSGGSSPSSGLSLLAQTSPDPPGTARLEAHPGVVVRKKGFVVGS